MIIKTLLACAALTLLAPSLNRAETATDTVGTLHSSAPLEEQLRLHIMSGINTVTFSENTFVEVLRRTQQCIDDEQLAGIINHITETGLNLLHEVCIRHWPNAIEMMLEIPGVDPSIKIRRRYETWLAVGGALIEYEHYNKSATQLIGELTCKVQQLLETALIEEVAVPA